MSSNYNYHVPSGIAEKVVGLLKNMNNDNRENTVSRLRAILGTVESKRILAILCNKREVDSDRIFSITDEDGNFADPKLILHLVLLYYCYDKSVDAMAEKLGVSKDNVLHILEQFFNIFSVDNPLEWLEEIIFKISKNSGHYSDLVKKNTRLGINITEKSEVSGDTAEVRKVKARKQALTNTRN